MKKKDKKGKKLFAAVIIVLALAVLVFVVIGLVRISGRTPETPEDKIVSNLVGCIKTNCTKLPTQNNITDCIVGTSGCYNNFFYKPIQNMGYGGTLPEQQRFISNLNDKNKEFYLCTVKCDALADGGYSKSSDFCIFKCFETMGVKIDWSKLTR